MKNTSPQATTNEENIAFDLLKIYPVPFSQEIHLQLEASSSNPITIKLLDLYGRTLLVEKQQLTKGISIFTLSTNQNLPEGIYLIQITDDYGNQKSKQITHFNQ